MTNAELIKTLKETKYSVIVRAVSGDTTTEVVADKESLIDYLEFIERTTPGEDAIWGGTWVEGYDLYLL